MFEFMLQFKCNNWTKQFTVASEATSPHHSIGSKVIFHCQKLNNIVNDHLWKTKELGNLKAIKYCRDNESNAFDAYRNQTGLNVHIDSLVVNNRFRGLGCSPDGLVYEKDSTISRLIWIKRPFKLMLYPWWRKQLKNKKKTSMLLPGNISVEHLFILCTNKLD